MNRAVNKEENVRAPRITIVLTPELDERLGGGAW